MSAYSSYKFMTEWTVQGTVTEVSSVLKDVEASRAAGKAIRPRRRYHRPGLPRTCRLAFRTRWSNSSIIKTAFVEIAARSIPEVLNE
jgi:hypothetical protein